MEVSDQIHAPAPLPLGMNSDTHSLGGFRGPRAGLGGFGEKQMFCDSYDSNPRPSFP